MTGTVQLRVELLGVRPPVWRRLLVPAVCTLRELHGVLQVAFGWEGIHLFQFCLRDGRRLGSGELWAGSPEVALGALGLRRGSRFLYEYDLHVPWQHRVRVEERLTTAAPVQPHPCCLGGAGAGPPEDCGGPAGFLAGRDEAGSWAAFEDLDTVADILNQVVLEGRTELLDDDGDTRWRLERALDRAKARERAQGRPFCRRMVNALLRAGEHRTLMHQQW